MVFALNRLHPQDLSMESGITRDILGDDCKVYLRDKSDCRLNLVGNFWLPYDKSRYVKHA